MSWERFKVTRQAGASAMVAGLAKSSASAAPRADLDFRLPPREPGAVSLLRRKIVSVMRRRHEAPVPAAQAQPQSGVRLVLARPRRVDPKQADNELMLAALAHVMPKPDVPPDARTRTRTGDLATRLLALDRTCATAAEHGISIERVLSALRVRCAGKAYEESLADAESFVRELADCLGRMGADGKPERTSVIRAALLLTMPGLCPQPWDKPGQGLSARLENFELSNGLADQLAKLELDAHFAGRPGYAFDRLLSALCNHARILEYGRTEQEVGRALEGLGAMVATVQDSVARGSDGYALNALIGIDAELDKTIASVRTDLVEQFMRDYGNPDGDDSASIRQHAVDLVQQECELAWARARMMRAFDRAGVSRPVEVVRGLKMDSALVAGLAKQLKSRAKDVGLAIMGVHLRERDLADSPAGRRMLRAVGAAKHEALTGAASMEPHDVLGQRHARATVAALNPREASLTDPGVISAALVDTLGLSGMDSGHVRQLERQGLSSAAEARSVLAKVQKAIDVWVADRGPERLMEENLQDVLRTRRQEDRARSLGEALLEKHQAVLQAGRLDDGALVSIDRADVRRDIVRAAIAHLVPDERQARGPKGMPVLASFKPSTDAVQNVLDSWGVCVDLTAEIGAETASAIDTGTLAAWVKDAALIDEPPRTPRRRVQAGKMLDLPQDEQGRRVAVRDAVRDAILDQVRSPTLDMQPNVQALRDALVKMGVDGAEAVIDEEVAKLPSTPAEFRAWMQEVAAADARRALVDALADVKIGTRVRMNHDQRIKLSTGTIGDTAGVGVRASAGAMTGVDFGNPGDPGGSWEVVLRAGADVKVGVDAMAPMTRIAGRMGLRVGPVGTAEGSGQYVGGVILRCKTSKDQQALARKLMENPTIGFDQLADVDSIMLLREMQGGGELGGGVQAALSPENAGFSWSDVRSTQMMLGARVTGHIGKRWARSVAENNKASIHRQETVTYQRVAATASIGFNLKASDGSQPGLSMSVAEAGIRMEQVTKARMRLFAGADGKVVDAEAFNQSFVAGDSAIDLMKKLGGPHFTSAMQHLAQESPEVHRNIVELIGDIRQNELGSIAWKLDTSAGYYPGNAAIEQANAARDHRMHTGGIGSDQGASARLRGEADRIFEDRRLYNLSRVAAIPTVETSLTKTAGFGLYETSQSTYAESLPEEIKLYAQELLMLATRARREMQYGVRSAA